MIIIDVTLGRQRKPEIISAGIDTGFDGGLLVNTRIAKSAGILLRDPVERPVDASDNPVDGQAGWGVLTIPELGVSRSTYIYCPFKTRRSVALVGEHFLSRVNTSIVINGVEIPLPIRPEVRFNVAAPPDDDAPPPDYLHLGWMTIPGEDGDPRYSHSHFPGRKRRR